MNIASIDLGSNTVLLLIVEVDTVTKRFKTICNQYRIPRIGQGLIPNQPIKSEKINLLIHILEEFKKIILQYDCKYTIVTATNALRIASNSKLIKDEIKNIFNFETNIISGKEESRLSYLGAVSEQYYKNKNLVIDIGGGSTEIIFGIDDQLLFNESYPIGVVNFTEKYFKNLPPKTEELNNFILKVNEHLNQIQKVSPELTIAIAGTPTTLACMKQKLNYFDENLIEGTILTNHEIKEFVDTLIQLNPTKILQSFGKIVEGREDVLLAGTLILNLVLTYFEVPEIIVSSKGIRYGAVVDFIQKNF
ncbi:MAG: hypothetical protein M1480_12130 [Bacteroidetes bacterium]|nr:hypothetical protein [Bacteroidota bacterium]